MVGAEGKTGGGGAEPTGVGGETDGVGPSVTGTAPNESGTEPAAAGDSTSATDAVAEPSALSRSPWPSTGDKDGGVAVTPARSTAAAASGGPCAASGWTLSLGAQYIAQPDRSRTIGNPKAVRIARPRNLFN